MYVTVSFRQPTSTSNVVEQTCSNRKRIQHEHIVVCGQKPSYHAWNAAALNHPGCISDRGVTSSLSLVLGISDCVPLINLFDERLVPSSIFMHAKVETQRVVRLVWADTCRVGNHCGALSGAHSLETTESPLHRNEPHQQKEKSVCEHGVDQK